MNEGKILFAEQNGIYFIQMLGEMRYTASPGLDRLIARIAEDPAARDVVVDLTAADYLDSTNLGLLAKVANLSHSKFNRKPILVSSNSNINTVLNGMGFEQVFQLVDNRSIPALAFEEPPGGTTDPDARLLLETHRLLAEMNKQNAATFHDVIELLETEASP